MPQPSKIEHHPQRAAIEAALFAGNEPLDALAETFNVSRDALHRWRKRNRPTASDADAALPAPSEPVEAAPVEEVGEPAPTEPESKRLARAVQAALSAERRAEAEKFRLRAAFERSPETLDIDGMERLHAESRRAGRAHLKASYTLKTFQIQHLDAVLAELDDEAQTVRDAASRAQAAISGRGWLNDAERLRAKFETGFTQAQNRLLQISNETRQAEERRRHAQNERDEIKRMLLRAFD